MEYESVILNKLLDKYEDRSHSSNRRVRIICGRKEIDIPDIDSGKYLVFRKDVLNLKMKGFIEFDWLRKDYIVGSIWLNLDNAEEAYRYLEREDRKYKVNAVVKLIDEALKETAADWIYNYLESSRDNMLKSNKLAGIWRSEHRLLINFLAALINIGRLNGKSISMRAFSIRVYGDPKLFEEKIKQHVVPVIRNNEPDLCDAEDIGDREVLAQAGIITAPEIFEFCGNVRIGFSGGTIDFSPLSKGACISGDCIFDILSIDIFETDKIIFIENKTNYCEYCLNNKTERELIVYHGGFCSPQRREFFRRLCAEVKMPVYFWGNIDYSGFRAFVRLKNIISSLQPMNMDILAYNRYKDRGLKKNDNYIAKLLLLNENPDYDVFSDVIEAIADGKTTVEQESFLEHCLAAI